MTKESSVVDPSTLPSVLLDEYKLLPDSPGIYIAIDGSGTIQYVGRSTNLRFRWGISHHRYDDLKVMQGVKIAYLLVERDLLDETELLLINQLSPALNGTKALTPAPQYGKDYPCFKLSLKKRRKELKLTQQQLADSTKVAIGTVRAWEQGRRLPGAQGIPELSQALNVTVGDIYRWIYQDQPPIKGR